MNPDTIEIRILSNTGQVIRDMQQLRQVLDDARRNSTIRMEANFSNRQQAHAAIRALENELARLNNRATIVSEAMRGMGEGADGLEEYEAELRQIEDAAERCAAMLAAARDAAIEFGEADVMISQFGDRLNAVADIARGLSAIPDTFVNSLSSINSLFNFDIVNQAMTMVRSAIIGATASLGENVVTRYDILSTFPQYMEAIGIASEDAQEALDRVDQAIRGLPIGLDESAQRLRRYQMFLGDLNQATNLTIGLQNAIFAGGANDQMRRTALYEIDRLLSAGDLASARQWNALIQGFGVSIKYIAEELGTTGKELPDMLATGAISAQSFLNALMELGKGESEAAQGLNELLSIYKTTLESWLSNIQYAFTRGGQRLSVAFNDALLSGTSKGLTDYLSLIRDGINEVFLSTSDFIREHDDVLAAFEDRFVSLSDALSRFNVGNIVETAFDYIFQGLDALINILGSLDTDAVEKFLGYIISISAPMEKILSMASAGTAWQAGLTRGFMERDQQKIIEAVARDMGRIEEAAYNISTAFLDDDQFADFFAGGLVYIKPLLSGLGSIIQFLAQIQILTGGAFGNLVAGLLGRAGAFASDFLETQAIRLLMLGDTTLPAGMATALGGSAVATTIFGSMGLFYKSIDDKAARQYRESVQASLRKAFLESGDREGAEVVGKWRTGAVLTNSERQLLLSAIEEEESRLQAEIDKTAGVKINLEVDGLKDIDLSNLQTGIDTLPIIQMQELQKWKEELKGEINEIEGIMQDAQNRIYISPIEANLYRLTEIEIRRLQQLKENYETIYRETVETVEGFEPYNPEELEQLDFTGGGTLYDARRNSLTRTGDELQKVLQKVNEAYGDDPEQLARALNLISERYNALKEEEGSDALQSFTEFLMGLSSSADKGKLDEVLDKIEGDIEGYADASERVSAMLTVLQTHPDILNLQQNLEKLKEVYAALLAGGDYNGAEVTGLFDGNGNRLQSFFGSVPWETGEKIEKIENELTNYQRTYDGVISGAISSLGNLVKATDDSTEAEQEAKKAADEFHGALDEGRGVIDDYITKQGEFRNDLSLTQQSLSELYNMILTLNRTHLSIQVDEFGVPSVTPQPSAPTVVKPGLTHSSGRFASATGGVVPAYNPIGTDTVPAMLTPGEYVVKRDAVRKYGSTLFDRFNSMNISDMFSSFTLNLPSVSNMSYTYNTTSNDNRQTSVNQYITTNNPNYTYRVANRFAHALQ